VSRAGITCWSAPPATAPAPEAAPRAEEEPDAEAPTGAPAPEARHESDAVCEATLLALGAAFRRLDPIDDGEGCAVAAPYALARPAPGVTLEPETQMTCETALATTRWVQSVAAPAARALGEGEALTGVMHGSTYVCRGRVGDAAQPSEHGAGQAIDIVSFRFRSGETVPVRPRKGEGTLTEAFQATVRSGACLFFTTVLGPGSDAHHDDHLHLDVRERPGDFRLCQ
jgi:hypothetical protein